MQHPTVFANAGRQAAHAMQAYPEYRDEILADPIAALERFGAPVRQLRPFVRRDLEARLSANANPGFDFKCKSCEWGLGAGLAAVGGVAIIPTLIASMESKAAKQIIDVIAAFSGLSFNAVVQVIDAVLALGGTPADLYGELIKKICQAMGAC